jgi:N-acetylmuramoyl-L-alanine amidase
MEIFIGSTMDQGSHLLDQSTRLAKVFHHELREIGDIKLKEAIVSQSLAVLRTNTSPAILLELGYMSHPGDLKLMTDESYQRRIADAFAKVLTSYN